jgi:hypothetical protein
MDFLAHLQAKAFAHVLAKSNQPIQDFVPAKLVNDHSGKREIAGRRIG